MNEVNQTKATQKLFDKENFKNDWRKLMTNWTEEQLEEYAVKMEKKYSTIKRGDNVVHLDYFGGLLNDNDISEIENLLSKNNLELSRFDKSGIPYASVDDFILQVALFLSDKTTQDVLIGLTSSALWDTIKTTTFYMWQTVRNRTQTIMTARTTKQRKINCGLKLSLDKNTKFEFKIDGELSEETALKSLDKVLDFMKTIKPNPTIKHADFVIFNTEKDIWEIVDVNAEMQKKMMEQKANEK